MKRKWLKIGLPLVVGGVLLAVSGLSAMAETSGYETYKAALKNNISAQSMTAQVSVNASDNGAAIMKTEALVKADKEHGLANVSVSIDDGQQTRTMNVYRQDDKVIFKNGEGDLYYKMTPTNRHSRMNESGVPEGLENIVDVLIGKLKDEVDLEKMANGQTQVSLHLAGSEIHPLVNLIGGRIVKNAGMHHEAGEHWKMQEQLFGGELEPSLPKLTEDVKVKTLNVVATITPDQHIADEQLRIELTGKDEAGKVHTVAVAVKAAFSAFNNTVTESLDVTGKQLQELQLPERHWQYHWRH